ncbi:MAG: hypothetical protein ABSH08_08825 [Tepidisphaeraceae bacterium]
MSVLREPLTSGEITGYDPVYIGLLALLKGNQMPAKSVPVNSSVATGSAASLLVDGSALFFGQRAASPDRNLDYTVLLDLMQRHGQHQWPARPAYFFTAADEANEKQAKFHQMIQGQLGWTVRQMPPHEAVVSNTLLNDGPSRIIRFDALIAYSLGRLAGRPDVSRVFIISDSWPLAACIKDCVGRGTPVTVCFFGDFIDTRFHKLFREYDASKLDFLDLEHEPRLFNRPRPTLRREDDVLNDLP